MVDVENSNQDSQAAFDELLEHLTPNNTRYVYFKAAYTTDGGRQAENVAMFMWCGSQSSNKNKMIYAGTFNTVKAACHSKMQHEYGSKSSLTYENMCARFKK